MVEGASASVTIRAAVEEIRPLMDRIARTGRAAGVPEATIDELCLCLDELLTNLIMHAGLGPDAEISVAYAIDPARVAAEITDPGPAFDPLSLPTPDVDAPLDERRPGGLGIHFVRTLMDEVRYERVNSRNRLRFAKRVAADSSSTTQP